MRTIAAEPEALLDHLTFGVLATVCTGMTDYGVDARLSK